MRVAVAILALLLVSACTTANQRKLIQECKDEGYIPRTKEFQNCITGLQGQQDWLINHIVR